ncbi:MAG: enoyl-CoA hydratase/isomerase family protein [Gemmatimonadota bacterium]
MIRLNRPDRMNAVSLPLYRELTELLTSLAEETENAEKASLRALILTGAGRAFCVGADLKSHGVAPSDAAWRREYVAVAQEAARRLQRFPTPTIAAVNGHAIGAGLELALSCDFVVVSKGAKLRFPEMSLGTFVGGGVTYTLSRRVGVARARELVLLCPMFGGQEALEMGLASRCVSADLVLAEAQEIAQRLASMAPLSIARATQLLREGFAADPEEAMAQEAEALLECMDSPDWIEGIRAFEEKRQPRFRGGTADP